MHRFPVGIVAGLDGKGPYASAFITSLKGTALPAAAVICQDVLAGQLANGIETIDGFRVPTQYLDDFDLSPAEEFLFTEDIKTLGECAFAALVLHSGQYDSRSLKWKSSEIAVAA